MSVIESIGKAACIGGGVIGGGWAARFVLNGIDVAVFDTDPEVERKVREVLGNAREAYRRITGAAPLEGSLTFSATIAEAVAGADLVQESVTERMEIKHRVLREIEQHAKRDALIASSTSGLRPSDLQEVLSTGDRFLVAHPFNPVYLLPLVEIVGGSGTASEAKDAACRIYDALQMKAVIIHKEIDGFVGVRLLEALWREALWLVKDGVTTVEELDDIMRYSFGLRWAQMGLFQTYRIAGGEAGMQQFLAHYGPCLKWPWSKLTDVPDLDDELIGLIVRQSDEQTGDLSIRELERIRDTNLVAIIEALSRTEYRHGTGWGAGALFRSFQARHPENDGVVAPDFDPTDTSSHPQCEANA